MVEPAFRPALCGHSYEDRSEAVLKAFYCYVATVLSVGSAGSLTLVSRSQPSFSSLMCSMATALAFASRSGRA